MVCVKKSIWVALVLVILIGGVFKTFPKTLTTNQLVLVNVTDGSNDPPIAGTTLN